jgi:transposase
VARAYPDRELHLVMDNYAAHKRVEIRDWLAGNPRIHVHFTPTSGSWLNLVEVWFGIIERQAIRRGSFTSVRDLMTKIRAFITGWNARKHPFIWTKPADEILTKINRKRNMSRLRATSGVSMRYVYALWDNEVWRTRRPRLWFFERVTRLSWSG